MGVPNLVNNSKRDAIDGDRILDIILRGEDLCGDPVPEEEWPTLLRETLDIEEHWPPLGDCSGCNGEDDHPGARPRGEPQYDDEGACSRCQNERYVKNRLACPTCEGSGNNGIPAVHVSDNFWQELLTPLQKIQQEHDKRYCQCRLGTWLKDEQLEVKDGERIEEEGEWLMTNLEMQYCDVCEMT